MRLRRLKHLDERKEQVAELIVLDNYAHAGKWKEVFGNDNPIFVEIGMGKGDFIKECALSNTGVNYIGIEKSDTVAILAAEKLGEKLPNLVFIIADAKSLMDIFGEGEVEKIYLNFSDPWPKARHEKRRLTFKTFLESYSKVLKEDGTIELKTDNYDLFTYSLDSLKSFGYEILEYSYDLHAEKSNVIKTEYEKKFIAKGNKINYLVAKNVRK